MAEADASLLALARAKGLRVTGAVEVDDIGLDFRVVLGSSPIVLAMSVARCPARCSRTSS